MNHLDTLLLHVLRRGFSEVESKLDNVLAGDGIVGGTWLVLSWLVGWRAS
jgi:hypothetical protein